MARPAMGGLGRLVILSVAFFCVRAESVCAQVTTEAGLNDLVILDPGKHERGLPAVEVLGDQIDIPPTVHVHRYYYSGDKIFHAPIIQGGPTVVVASHPKTGERMYIDVVLPAGAPRIAYTKNTITYIYKERRVEVKFQHFPFDPCVAVVKHHSGKGIGIRLRDKHEHVTQHVKETMVNSQMINSIKDLSTEGGKVVGGVASSIGTLSTKGTDSIKQLSNLIPGMTYLKSLGDQKPQQDYEGSLRHATLKKEKAEIPFIRTNR